MIFFIHLFVFCCFLQSISSSSDEMIFPPDRTWTRVVGGTDAPDGAFPYQCSLQTNRNHRCGCSILSNKWILTAAHCVPRGLPNNLEILVGTNDLKNGGKHYKTTKLVSHKSYNNPRYAYDIALIQVEGTIDFSDKVQPIEPSFDEVPDDVHLQLTGWGALAAGGHLPQLLQIINLKSVSTNLCRNSTIGHNIHESHFCTFNKHGEGACFGDSGGPLVYNNKVVGVVNFGLPCARGSPDAFAKISYLYVWIKQNTQ